MLDINRYWYRLCFAINFMIFVPSFLLKIFCTKMDFCSVHNSSPNIYDVHIHSYTFISIVYNTLASINRKHIARHKHSTRHPYKYMPHRTEEAVPTNKQITTERHSKHIHTQRERESEFSCVFASVPCSKHVYY